jgi:hypothetical protein
MSMPALRLCAALLITLALAPRSLPGQTHPGGRWWTLETAHFRVHVRPEQRELGRRAALEAESVWTRLARILPPPGLRLDLVVSDHADEANGFAATFPTPRVIVYPVPPAGDIQLQNYDTWLRLVLTHELAHIFHLDLAGGWWRVARRVFGRAPGLFPNAYTPTWLTEGLAVFYESRLTTAGRLGGSFHRGVAASASREAGGVPIDAAGALSPRWPGAIRPYALGGEFFAALADTGDSLVARLALAGARAPVPYLSLNGTLRSAGGESLTRAWADWQDSLREPGAGSRTLGDGTREPGADTRREPLTLVCCLRVPVPPRLSPDGRALLYAHGDGRDVTRLAELDLTTGEVRLWSRLNAGNGLAWDGDAAAIVSQLEFLDPYTPRADLWRVTPGGSERRLTVGARLRGPAAGAGGAVFAVRVVPGGSELVRVRRAIAGDSARQSGPRHGGHSPVEVDVLASAPGVEWAHPVASPDGELVAATRVERGWHDVALVSARTGELTLITRDSSIDQMPAFSPDGRRLYWSREVGGVSQVVSVALPLDHPATPVLHTRSSFGAYGPAPAADTLYYLAYHHSGFAIEAVAAADTSPAPLPGRESLPVIGGEEPVAVVRREHGYRPWPSLLPRFWLPTWVTGSGGSSWVGLYTAGVDVLQRHAYDLELSAGVGDAAGTWRGGFAYRYAGITPVVLDAFYDREQLAFLTGAPEDPFGCCVTDEEAGGGVTVRRRRWRTDLAARLGAEYRHTGGVERAGAVLSLAAGHVLVPALAVSAQDGWRASVTLRRRWRLDAPGYYNEFQIRGSGFKSLDLPGFTRHVIAARAAAGIAGGTEQPAFLVGGVSGGTVEFLPGVVIGGTSRSFPVRGYAPGALLGPLAATLSVEYRPPVALVGRGLGLWPLFLDRLSLAVFADAGVTWARANCAAGTLGECSDGIGSVGAELVSDTGIGYDFPVRLRFGAAKALTMSGGAGYVAVGAWF